MSTEFTPLKSDEVQLFELARLSNIAIDERIFKILLELLKLNVKPEAIIQVLKVLAKQNQSTLNSSWTRIFAVWCFFFFLVKCDPQTSVYLPVDYICWQVLVRLFFDHHRSSARHCPSKQRTLFLLLPRLRDKRLRSISTCPTPSSWHLPMSWRNSKIGKHRWPFKKLIIMKVSIFPMP